MHHALDGLTGAARIDGEKTSSMTNVAAGCAKAGAERHSNCEPRPTSPENGTGHFTEAAVHSQ